MSLKEKLESLGKYVSKNDLIIQSITSLQESVSKLNRNLKARNNDVKSYFPIPDYKFLDTLETHIVSNSPVLLTGWVFGNAAGLGGNTSIKFYDGENLIIELNRLTGLSFPDGRDMLEIVVKQLKVKLETTACNLTVLFRRSNDSEAYFRDFLGVKNLNQSV